MTRSQQKKSREKKRVSSGGGAPQTGVTGKVYPPRVITKTAVPVPATPLPRPSITREPTVFDVVDEGGQVPIWMDKLGKQHVFTIYGIPDNGFRQNVIDYQKLVKEEGGVTEAIAKIGAKLTPGNGLALFVGTVNLVNLRGRKYTVTFWCAAGDMAGVERVAKMWFRQCAVQGFEQLEWIEGQNPLTNMSRGVWFGFPQQLFSDLANQDMREMKGGLTDKEKRAMAIAQDKRSTNRRMIGMVNDREHESRKIHKAHVADLNAIRDKVKAQAQENDQFLNDMMGVLDEREKTQYSAKWYKLAAEAIKDGKVPISEERFLEKMRSEKAAKGRTLLKGAIDKMESGGDSKKQLEEFGKGLPSIKASGATPAGEPGAPDVDGGDSHDGEGEGSYDAVLEE
jgi:hypothetical protein